MSANGRYERTSEVISPRTRDRLRREIDDLGQRMKNRLVVPGANGDGDTSRMVGRLARFIDPAVRENAGILARRRQRLQEVLSKGSPDSLTRGQRAQMERRRNALKEQLQRQMCPKKIYHVRSSKDPATFEKAKEACMQEQTPEFRAKAQEYKQIVRELDPDDPKAASLENIRPK
jgi:hypothetical protein